MDPQKYNKCILRLQHNWLMQFAHNGSYKGSIPFGLTIHLIKFNKYFYLICLILNIIYYNKINLFILTPPA